MIARPTVSYERVKRVAPKRVEVVLSLAGRTHSCTVPVVTRETEVRQT